MSIQNFVFLSESDLPEVEALNSCLKSEAVPLVLPAEWSLSSEDLVLVKGDSEGRPCVFDYALAAYQDKDWSWSASDAPLFEGVAWVAMFNCNSNAQEILALMGASCVLANETQGLLYAPMFSDDLLAHHQAMPLLKAHMPSILGQFSGPSKLRSL